MENLKGFNGNKFVEDNHVFVPGDGCWFETKELADKNFSKTGNEVGLCFVEKDFDGI